MDTNNGLPEYSLIERLFPKCPQPKQQPQTPSTGHSAKANEPRTVANSKLTKSRHNKKAKQQTALSKQIASPQAAPQQTSTQNIPLQQQQQHPFQSQRKQTNSLPSDSKLQPLRRVKAHKRPQKTSEVPLDSDRSVVSTSSRAPSSARSNSGDVIKRHGPGSTETAPGSQTRASKSLSTASSMGNNDASNFNGLGSSDSSGDERPMSIRAALRHSRGESSTGKSSTSSRRLGGGKYTASQSLAQRIQRSHHSSYQLSDGQTTNPSADPVSNQVNENFDTVGQNKLLTSSKGANSRRGITKSSSVILNASASETRSATCTNNAPLEDNSLQTNDYEPQIVKRSALKEEAGIARESSLEPVRQPIAENKEKNDDTSKAELQLSSRRVAPSSQSTALTEENSPVTQRDPATRWRSTEGTVSPFAFPISVGGTVDHPHSSHDLLGAPTESDDESVLITHRNEDTPQVSTNFNDSEDRQCTSSKVVHPSPKETTVSLTDNLISMDPATEGNNPSGHQETTSSSLGDLLGHLEDSTMTDGRNKDQSRHKLDTAPVASDEGDYINLFVYNSDPNTEILQPTTTKDSQPERQQCVDQTSVETKADRLVRERDRELKDLFNVTQPKDEPANIIAVEHQPASQQLLFSGGDVNNSEANCNEVSNDASIEELCDFNCVDQSSKTATETESHVLASDCDPECKQELNRAKSNGLVEPGALREELASSLKQLSQTVGVPQTTTAHAPSSALRPSSGEVHEAVPVSNSSPSQSSQDCAAEDVTKGDSTVVSEEAKLGKRPWRLSNCAGRRSADRPPLMPSISESPRESESSVPTSPREETDAMINSPVPKVVGDNELAKPGTDFRSQEKHAPPPSSSTLGLRHHKLPNETSHYSLVRPNALSSSQSLTTTTQPSRLTGSSSLQFSNLSDDSSDTGGEKSESVVKSHVTDRFARLVKISDSLSQPAVVSSNRANRNLVGGQPFDSRPANVHDDEDMIPTCKTALIFPRLDEGLSSDAESVGDEGELEDECAMEADVEADDDDDDSADCNDDDDDEDDGGGDNGVSDDDDDDDDDDNEVDEDDEDEDNDDDGSSAAAAALAAELHLAARVGQVTAECTVADNFNRRRSNSQQRQQQQAHHSIQQPYLQQQTLGDEFGSNGTVNKQSSSSYTPYHDASLEQATSTADASAGGLKHGYQNSPNSLNNQQNGSSLNSYWAPNGSGSSSMNNYGNHYGNPTPTSTSRPVRAQGVKNNAVQPPQVLGRSDEGELSGINELANLSPVEALCSSGNGQPLSGSHTTAPNLAHRRMGAAPRFARTSGEQHALAQQRPSSDTDNETDRLLGSQRAAAAAAAAGNSSTSSSHDPIHMSSASGGAPGVDATPGAPTASHPNNASSRQSANSREVLIEGVLFNVKYLGSTHTDYEDRGEKEDRIHQAEMAVQDVKFRNDASAAIEVQLFISTEKIMVLDDKHRKIMMDHSLRTISYIADIGDAVVLIAHKKVPVSMVQQQSGDISNSGDVGTLVPIAQQSRHAYKVSCHVFESSESHTITKSISQAFQVAYTELLKANGTGDPSSHLPKELDYQDVLNSQEMSTEELDMFARKENQREVIVPKQKGEIIGLSILESGWGSMLPTMVIASLKQGSPAYRCKRLSIGDQILSVNGISLVGLSLSECQKILRKTKNQTVARLSVVPCPITVEVKIRRPDTKYQLGFSVQNGVICSLLRGGIAERGGVRVGHRIMSINGTTVVNVPHEKIVTLLASSVGEIRMKTCLVSLCRTILGEENPVHL